VYAVITALDDAGQPDWGWGDARERRWRRRATRRTRVGYGEFARPTGQSRAVEAARSVDGDAPASHGRAVPAAASQGFSVVSRRLEHGVLVAVAGEVDIATAPVLERDLRQAQQTAGVVVLDLAEVSFMDCSGLGAILSANRHAREHHGRLVVVGAARQTRRLVELTGAVDQLALVDAPVGALGAAATR
jgi:anti-sigma B factor antagonist